MSDVPSMNPYLREFWAQPSSGKVLHGGRMSSKSWDAAANLVRIMQMCKVRVLCTRMFQNKIDESVYSLIKSQVDRFGLTKRFEFTKASIKCTDTGSEAFFYGLARNIDEIKSMENISILWMEEAHSVTKEMWQILEPTIIRNKSAECWIIFNPKFATDFAYQRFVINPPKGYIVKQINYDNNPFLPQSALDKIEEAKAEDYDQYAHIYLGQPLTDDDKVIIRRAWLMSAIDAHKKLGIEPTGEKRIGFDVADSGGDLNAAVSAHGCLTTGISKRKGDIDGLVDTAAWAYGIARDMGALLRYDPIGVGASIGANVIQFNELHSTSVKHEAWNAGGKIVNPEREYKHGIKNKDMFSNAKSQAWWSVSDRLLETHNAVTKGQDYDPANIISISGDCENIEALITELSTPFKDFDETGKVKVESKADLSKRGIKSPNLADAFIIAYAPVVAVNRMNWGAI